MGLLRRSVVTEKVRGPSGAILQAPVHREFPAQERRCDQIVNRGETYGIPQSPDAAALRASAVWGSAPLPGWISAPGCTFPWLSCQAVYPLAAFDQVISEGLAC